MKGKDLNKRLRELRIQREAIQNFRFKNHIVLTPVFDDLKQVRKALDPCSECGGFDIHNVVYADLSGTGWYCKTCKKLVEIETKNIKESL